MMRDLNLAKISENGGERASQQYVQLLYNVMSCQEFRDNSGLGNIFSDTFRYRSTSFPNL